MTTAVQEWLKTEELAARINVRGNTVREWARLGLIPFTYIGKQKRYLWPDVFEVIKNMRPQRPTDAAANFVGPEMEAVG